MPLEVIGGKLAGVGGLLYRPDLDIGGQPRLRVLFYDPLGVLVTDAVQIRRCPSRHHRPPPLAPGLRARRPGRSARHREAPGRWCRESPPPPGPRCPQAAASRAPALWLPSGQRGALCLKASSSRLLSISLRSISARPPPTGRFGHDPFPFRFRPNRPTRPRPRKARDQYLTLPSSGQAVRYRSTKFCVALTHLPRAGPGEGAIGAAWHPAEPVCRRSSS